MKRFLTLGAVLVALLISGCGGDDEDTEAGTAPSNGLQAPSGATPPSSLGALPPGFVECMAEQGFDVQSSADIHAAPPQVLQACFGSSH